MATDMPFEVDPQLAADVESALTGVTVDPNQVGVSDLHTQLHFRDVARDFISSRNQKLLVADIEDLYAAVDVLELSGNVLDNALVAPLLVIEALDDMFGDVHDPYADDDDEDGDL